MSTFAETIADSLKQIEAYLGDNKFTWEGNEYTCSPSGIGEGGQLISGGILSESDLVLVVRLCIFPNGHYPSEGIISYRGKEYRIDSDRVNVTGTFVRLSCVDPDRVGADD